MTAAGDAILSGRINKGPRICHFRLKVIQITDDRFRKCNHASKALCRFDHFYRALRQ
jgi:hypothetical protein